MRILNAHFFYYFQNCNFMAKELTYEQKAKLLTVVSLLPVLADYIEDIPLFHNSKRIGNMFINEVRKLDEKVLFGADIEALEQQISLQRAFREWIKVNLIDEE